MLKAEQIPEVVWRVAMVTYHREIRRNPEQAWQLAIAAAITTWPELVERHYPNDPTRPPGIFLPLQKQEGGE